MTYNSKTFVPVRSVTVKHLNVMRGAFRQ